MLLLPLTKHSGKYRQTESGMRAGAQLSSGICADADRNVANGFILSPTEMLKWESWLAPLFFYATVAVLKQSPMEEPEEQRERLARVVGRSQRPSPTTFFIPPESKTQLWNLQVRRV